MFAIGEFSRITGLTVKALRFYHDRGLLVPTFVDPQTGYRYYDESDIETARTIAYLRQMEFSLAQIEEVLGHRGDDVNLLDAIERHKAAIEKKVKSLRNVVRSLEKFISDERQAIAMAMSTHEVQDNSWSRR